MTGTAATPSAAIPDGYVVQPSPRTVDDLLARLDAALAARGLTVFARFDHAAAAAAVGLAMPALTVVAFGDPRAGTHLMLANPAIGIELPVKMIVWADAAGASHVAYTDPRWLAARYGVAESPIVGKLTAMLAALATEISAPR
jgi:uncharacterized protein (DUF302 family)|nr:DUF302 domain-containing protein [Kofleriaceae bacterium]